MSRINGYYIEDDEYPDYEDREGNAYEDKYAKIDEKNRINDIRNKRKPNYWK